jgi:hypothetical protein
MKQPKTIGVYISNDGVKAFFGACAGFLAHILLPKRSQLKERQPWQYLYQN